MSKKKESSVGSRKRRVDAEISDTENKDNAVKEASLVTKIVKMSNVFANDFNYNRQSNFIFEKQKLSIKMYGFVEPIICRKFTGEINYEGVSGETWEIINGEHRYLALKELFASSEKVHLDLAKKVELPKNHIPIIDLGDVSRLEAKQLCIVLNELKGKPDQDMLAMNIAELQQEEIDLSAFPYAEIELDAFSRLVSSGVDEDDSDTDGVQMAIDDDDDFDDENTLKKMKRNANLTFFTDLFGLEAITEDQKTYIYNIFHRFLKEEEIASSEPHKGLLGLFKFWDKSQGEPNV